MLALRRWDIFGALLAWWRGGVLGRDWNARRHLCGLGRKNVGGLHRQVAIGSIGVQGGGSSGNGCAWEQEEKCEHMEAIVHGGLCKDLQQPRPTILDVFRGGVAGHALPSQLGESTRPQQGYVGWHQAHVVSPEEAIGSNSC